MTTIGNAGQGETQANPPSQADGETAVPQDVQQKFDQVFGPRADDAPQARATEAAAPTTQHRPAATQRRAQRAQARRSAAAREQEDELVETGLLDDGSQSADPQQSDDAVESEVDGEQQPPPPGKARQEGHAPTLDPALRQAAKRAGWDDEEIEGFHEKDPAIAERTFARLQSHYNDLSMQYARLGQQQMQAAPQAPQQRPAPTPQQQNQAVGNALERLFAPQALDEMRAVQGDDFVDRFLVPLQREIVEPFRVMQQYFVQQQQATLAQQVTAIFDGWAKDGFDDVYGAGGNQTAEQVQARAHACQIADQIIEGAARQGIQMPVAEAMDRAHSVLTAGRAGEIERRKLTEQVRNRSRQITARPTQRRVARTAEDGARRSEVTAMEAYAQKAAELGLDMAAD